MVFKSMSYNSIKLKILMLLTLLTMAVSVTSLAGNQTSPYTNLNIIALEIIEPENILRLYVKRRIEIDAPVFDFNPANCPVTITEDLEVNVKSVGDVQYFDIQLGEINRSAVDQRQLLSEVFISFLTSSEVRLLVNDQACSSMSGRLVSGIRVNKGNR